MLLRFSVYLREEKVKRGSPDISEAKGLMEAGIKDIETIKSFEFSENAAHMIFKNIYDAIRSVLQAFLSKEGYTPYSHEVIISFNLEKNNITPEEANKLDKFRQLRNDISYRAAKATVKEAKELYALASSISARLKNKI